MSLPTNDVLDEFEDWYEDYMRIFSYPVREAVADRKDFLRAAWCAAKAKYSTPVIINSPTGPISQTNHFS